MNVKILLFLLFSFSSATLFAQQTYTVKGITIDKISEGKLVNMTVCILNAKDSILVKYSYTNENGAFLFKGNVSGNFIMLISYPDYADYVETFTLDSSRTVYDVGRILMKRKAELLNEVIITGKIAAIELKGDTTEFNAKAYVIQPNDKVEDLLKQLPGIQVDQNGKITAHGQTVSKVLLDGEEFFSDDPTLVTKNIRADMVKKVQLYDKKSDLATFTGIEDGIKTKTINIQLKEDKKNGVFGKVNAGIGIEDYYEGQAMFNKFKGNTKYAVYGTVANDGKTGLGGDDNSRIGSSNMQMKSKGLLKPSNGSDALDSYDGTYDGMGNPLVRSGGIHYDSKWNENNESINTDYQIGSINVNGVNTNNTQQSLPTSLINSNSRETYDNHAFQQKLDATYKVKINTSSDLKIMTNGAIKNFRVRNNYETATEIDNNILNEQNRTVTNHGNQSQFGANIFYAKKLKKERRTFSWSIDESYDQYRTNGYLNSATDFYNALGAIDNRENVNQYKTTNITNQMLNNYISYTEPLSKSFSMIFNYGLVINNSTANRKSFDQSASDVYNVLDTAFSNDYSFNQLRNQLRSVINYSKGKSYGGFGTSVSNLSLKQINENTGNVYRRSSIYLEPEAFYSYQISPQRSFVISFRGNNIQPNIDELQPVKTNVDPLNITLGNPNLKSSFTSNIDLSYHENNIARNRSILINGIYSINSNAITNNITTDVSTGKTTIQYINIAGETPYNYRLYGTFGRKITPLGINVSLTLDSRGNIFYNYINGTLNRSATYSYSGFIELRKNKKDAYSFLASAGTGYSVNRFSLQEENNNDARGFNSRGVAHIFLPFKFKIVSEINYAYTAKTQTFEAQQRTILNASLNKTFLKENSLKLSISGNDLLNQNVLFSRRVAGNNIIQSTYSGIKRYFMFSVSWDFTKFGMVPVKS